MTDVQTYIPPTTSTSTATSTVTVTSTNPADDYRGAGFATFVETVNGVGIYEVEIIQEDIIETTTPGRTITEQQEVQVTRE